MSRSNWALAERGALVEEVSEEATHVASSVNNLLLDREDLLWITGDAPQHVTFRLVSSHPPLLYVGWHVWHDYMSNPKTVEVASGESPERMAAAIVCTALPGAGTQVWKLPNVIPGHHEYVRFKILSTFGPGPTYMNHAVLLATEPGPQFCGDDLVRSAGHARLGRHSISPNPEMRCDAAPSSLLLNDATETSATKRTIETPCIEPAAAPHSRSWRRGLPVSSSTRMGRLLQDLQADIHLLRKIPAVSPRKTMMSSSPQTSLFSRPISEDSSGDGGDRDGDDPSGSCTLPGDRTKYTQHPCRTGSHECEDLDSATTCTLTSVGQPCVEGLRDRAPAVIVSTDTYGDRLCALEDGVTFLNLTLRRQGEDLAMIKRILLHQAVDRRAKVRKATPAHPDRDSSHNRRTRFYSEVAANPTPTHHHAAVELPEDSVRHIVDDILVPKLRRHRKKVEARLYTRLDACLHHVVMEMKQIVADRLHEHIEHAGDHVLPDRAVSLLRTHAHEADSRVRHAGVEAGRGPVVAASTRTTYNMPLDEHHHRGRGSTIDTASGCHVRPRAPGHSVHPYGQFHEAPPLTIPERQAHYSSHAALAFAHHCSDIPAGGPGLSQHVLSSTPKGIPMSHSAPISIVRDMSTETDSRAVLSSHLR